MRIDRDGAAFGKLVGIAHEIEQRLTQPHLVGNSAVERTTPLPPNLAAAKQAIELVRRHKSNDATTLAASTGDPVVAKLVEWALLRRFASEAGFDRYVSFIRANPGWPSIPLLRRLAEVRLWQERRDSATVRRFVGEALLLRCTGPPRRAIIC